MNRKNHYNNTFRDELRKKIDRITSRVFSRDDLIQDHSNQVQLRLNRALRTFMDEGIIIKIAHGLFAKAEPMSIPGRKIQAVLTEPFETVVTEALDKLGIKWELGSAIRDYNAGKTTQVPAVFSVRLKSRYRGSIHAEGRKLIFEGGINAR
ncbi:TPA: hypothetical protein JBD37_12210 [Legionella pneumophila subsp. pneumophila]|uniref:hypothetical protein n=1 Tax=Legionella pneumophila TaxID=446 RepID=UPI0007708BD3|nr:hypothetical protein [Legionella pneumophila]HAT8853489.1 hypothetical protein [Legionella pneumophila subsp. pneumophila]APF04004.1 hypothetical protein BIZ52_11785 [Legionella pneumophila subsp. fraseri]MCW8438571.1 hypothetical protein [Legionella pneumophila]MCW8480992.1 hypothetical protein [Legionella pneumophila]MCZ4726431.1 hypothetical protein [Legionella pneumophila]